MVDVADFHSGVYFRSRLDDQLENGSSHLLLDNPVTNVENDVDDANYNVDISFLFLFLHAVLINCRIIDRVVNSILIFSLAAED